LGTDFGKAALLPLSCPCDEGQLSRSTFLCEKAGSTAIDLISDGDSPISTLESKRSERRLAGSYARISDIPPSFLAH
jgi:hypothetical protein